jgi:hypothetical protein
MRSLGERLTKLNMKLTDLKCGPGAAIMPANVSRIHMDFALQMAGGHVGAKYVSSSPNVGSLCDAPSYTASTTGSSGASSSPD